MADGYAQARGNAAVINLHSAAGVGHGMGNLFTARRNRTPLVVIAGQQARSMLVGEPFLFAERPTELPHPYVKWASEPARAQDVPAALARAYHVAMSPPRGPVFVSVPVDDWDAPMDRPGPDEPRAVSTAIRADPELLADVGRVLAAARRPGFVAGAGVDRDHAFAEMVQLAQRHRARVWAAPMSARCGFPESHPLFAGFLPATREGIRERLAEHDVVLVVGAPGVFLPRAGQRSHARRGHPTDPADRRPGHRRVDPGRHLGGDQHSARPARPAHRRPARRAARPAGPETATPGVRGGAGVRGAGHADPRRAASAVEHVEEAPSSRPIMQAYLPFDGPETFFTCASGGLGHGLPAAVGVAMARPAQQVIALLGDGSSMYSIQGLWTAAREGLPVVFVVVNNGGYAALDQFAEHFRIDKPVGTALPGIDFAGLARDMGCSGLTVWAAKELPHALRSAFADPGPSLVDIHVA